MTDRAKVLQQNIQWHKTEGYYYESTHPENYNIIEQKRLRRQIKVFCGDLGIGNRILDLGSGTGNLVHLVRRYGKEPVACDLSLEMLQENPAENRVLCDATRLPFRDGVFGGVMSYSVFHHFPDPVAAVEEVVRVSASESSLLFDHDPFLPHETRRIGHYGFTLTDMLGWLIWLAVHPSRLWRLAQYALVGRHRHLRNIRELGDSEDEGRVVLRDLEWALLGSGYVLNVESYGKNSCLKARRYKCED